MLLVTRIAKDFAADDPSVRLPHKLQANIPGPTDRIGRHKGTPRTHEGRQLTVLFVQTSCPKW
jgi:hypothetical protein